MSLPKFGFTMSVLSLYYTCWGFLLPGFCFFPVLCFFLQGEAPIIFRDARQLRLSKPMFQKGSKRLTLFPCICQFSSVPAGIAQLSLHSHEGQHVGFRVHRPGLTQFSCTAMRLQLFPAMIAHVGGSSSRAFSLFLFCRCFLCMFSAVWV